MEDPDRLKSHKLTGPGLYNAGLCLIARIADILNNAGAEYQGVACATDSVTGT